MSQYPTAISQTQLSYVFSQNRTPLFYKVVNKILQKPFGRTDEEQAMSKQFFHKIVLKYKYNATSDSNIYLDMHNFMNTIVYPKIGYPDNESSSRSLSRVNDIVYMLNQIGSNNSPKKYVDIGCSEGGITQHLGKKLGLSHVIGCDVIDPLKIKQVDVAATMEYVKIENNKLPFEDKSVDFATMLMCLHHVKDHEKYIEEIARIIEPGGLFVIQEHDAQTEDDKIALDILHGMYSIVWNKTGQMEDADFCKTYESFYKSREEWSALLLKNGFEEIRVSLDSKKIRGIPRNNIHNNYWAVYRRTDNK